MDKLKRGTQIIYVPPHAESTDDPACERGFVTSVTEDGAWAWCRYWLKNTDELRTKSVSERTPTSTLVVEDTFPQKIINEKLAEIGFAPCKICNRDCRTAFPACLKAHGESI